MAPGVFSYRWGVDGERYSIVNIFAEVTPVSYGFIRIAYSHAWSKSRVICTSGPCPAEQSDPQSFIHAVAAIGPRWRKAHVYIMAGPEHQTRATSGGSHMIPVWGVGAAARVTSSVDVMVEHLRHVDTKLREYAGDSWEIDLGAKYGFGW